MVLFPYVLVIYAYWMRDHGKPFWAIRKFIHTLGLIIVGVYASYLETLAEILIVLFMFITILLVFTLIPRVNLFFTLIEMGTRKGEKEIESIINTSLTSTGMIVLLLVFFDVRWIFLAGVLSVGLGDGLGEFIGKPYGKHKFNITAPKSIEGSIGVFAGTLIGALFAFLSLNSTSISDYELFILIIASLTAMIIEAVSISFMDNILMPWAVGGILWLFI
jgi:dolichol kinase